MERGEGYGGSREQAVCFRLNPQFQSPPRPVRGVATISLYVQPLVTTTLSVWLTVMSADIAEKNIDFTYSTASTSVLNPLLFRKSTPGQDTFLSSSLFTFLSTKLGELWTHKDPDKDLSQSRTWPPRSIFHLRMQRPTSEFHRPRPATSKRRTHNFI